MRMKKSTKFIIVSILGLAVVISFMWFGLYQKYQSPKEYIETFEAAGFTVVKADSKLDLGSVIWTNDMNQFADNMMWWTSKMREPIIYWYRDARYGLVFYYIDIQGRSMAFMPQFG